DVLALGIAGAPDERAVPADPLQQGLAALRARLAGLLGLRPLLAVHVARVPAFGIVLAAHELPAPAELDDELAGLPALLRADRAELVELLLRALDLVFLL